jgi:hypothetical protein
MGQLGQGPAANATKYLPQRCLCPHCIQPNSFQGFPVLSRSELNSRKEPAVPLKPWGPVVPLMPWSPVVPWSPAAPRVPFKP